VTPFVHVTVYGVVTVGLTVSDPDVAPPVGKLVPAQLVAPCDAQVRSDCSPEIIDVGLATSEAVSTVAGHTLPEL